MKFRKDIPLPKPSEGQKITDPPQVVPDQSLSLAEILERFVRKEALPVGHAQTYGSDLMDPESDSELNVDLEKLRHADLVEKDEFKEKVEWLKRDHEQLEKARAEKESAKKAEDAKLAYEKSVRIAARKLAKQSGGKPDSI